MKKKVLAGMLALAMCLSACTPKSDPEETGLFKAGTYTAEAQGMNGAVKVEVVFTADRIETVTVTDHAETAGISDPAIERVPDAITEHQSLGGGHGGRRHHHLQRHSGRRGGLRQAGRRRY